MTNPILAETNWFIKNRKSFNLKSQNSVGAKAKFDYFLNVLLDYSMLSFKQNEIVQLIFKFQSKKYISKLLCNKIF